MNDVQASLREGIEEAIDVLAFRDIVYFDPFAKRWEGCLEPDDVVLTAFGEVLCDALMPRDGTIVCKHPSGKAYIKGDWITRDREGRYCVVDKAATVPPRGRAAEYYQVDDDDDDARRQPQPTAIDLRGCYVQAGDMRRLTLSLATNYFVQSLHLGGNGLRDESLLLLSAALATNGSLQTLVLSYNAITAVGAIALAEALATNAALTHLDVAHNQIGSEGCLAWLNLKTNSTLRTLHMSHNPAIADGGGVDLLRPLAAEPLSLADETRQKLLLKSKSRTYTATLLDAPANTSLVTLTLSEIGLSEASACRLQHVLSTTSVLTSLDVSMNSLSLESSKALARGLAANASLTYLHAGANVLDDEIGDLMATALGAHPRLRTALFPASFHGPHAGSYLAKTLLTTLSLSHMDISGGLLEPPGIVALCKAIGTNATLRVLELTSIGLKSDTIVQVLSTALEANTTLLELHLGYNSITLRGCKLLRDAISATQCQLTPETLVLEGNSGTKARGSSVLISGGSLSPTMRPEHPNSMIDKPLIMFQRPS
ncbi:hypothetical protein SDRG_01044 [Saprolegnia diclina VS20]|uniref:RNI-like protein n=1 Tax=Saprolegnia diclina (strain VS20) TaxID=1156394 RepID=T0R5J0_SAPDV|nr:hypothetical protein SDRG_01044 [Saprolegnia diclina VS20]EQC42206.1 hypothetical protein SDRG_01044 [Saprolegnia diclina VS20]|eukprot:XP_008604775.1 hypothetical protein SDRG_01044 [Saprolegnia diclina VS20]